MPSNEKTRLRALVTTLEQSARALRAGQIDLTTARSLVKTGLVFALSELKGAGLAVLFGALGTYTGSFSGSPFGSAAGAAAGLVLGVIADVYLDDSAVVDAVAGALTDGLFNGAEAFAGAINAFTQKLWDMKALMPGYPQLPSELFFDMVATPSSDGTGYEVTLYNNGNPWRFNANRGGSLGFPGSYDPAGQPTRPGQYYPMPI